MSSVRPPKKGKQKRRKPKKQREYPKNNRETKLNNRKPRPSKKGYKRGDSKPQKQSRTQHETEIKAPIQQAKKGSWWVSSPTPRRSVVSSALRASLARHLASDLAGAGGWASSREESQSKLGCGSLGRFFLQIINKLRVISN